MDLPLEHLKTLAAIVDEGSLEGAARFLHVSPSAVSQRVRSMEDRLGSVLLVRTRPIAVTDAGAAVLRAARQVARVIDDVAQELTPGGAPGDDGSASGALVRLVVNADSLATWFLPALARAAAATNARFEVLRADESVSADRLRSGEAMAALTSTPDAIPGCVSSRIGIDRYYAVASPAFFERHFASGVTPAALATAPIIEFDRSDRFQQRFLSHITRTRLRPPRHFVPSSAEFAAAIELGMGWGMVPRLQCATGLANGTLRELAPESSLELPLYWQRWNLRSPVLDTLSDIVAEEAQRALAPA